MLQFGWDSKVWFFACVCAWLRVWACVRLLGGDCVESVARCSVSPEHSSCEGHCGLLIARRPKRESVCLLSLLIYMYSMWCHHWWLCRTVAGHTHTHAHTHRHHVAYSVWVSATVNIITLLCAIMFLRRHHVHATPCAHTHVRTYTHTHTHIHTHTHTHTHAHTHTH